MLSGLSCSDHQRPFDIICDAALTKDDEKLKHGLSLACIGVSHYNGTFLSPVSKLAEENKSEAVQYLIEHKASISDAVYGYTKGGHKIKACEILSETKSHYCKTQSTYELLLGHSLRGDVDETNKLLDKILLDKQFRLSIVFNLIFFGYTAGGFSGEASNLLKNLISKHYPEYKTLAYASIGEGLASLGKVKEVCALIEECKTQAEISIDGVLVQIIRSFARHLHIQEADDFFKTYKQISSDPGSLLFEMIQAMYTGGGITEFHRWEDQYVEEYNFTPRQVINKMAEGLACGGHKDRIVDLIQETEESPKIQMEVIAKASQFYARYGHFDGMDDLIIFISAHYPHHTKVVNTYAAYGLGLSENTEKADAFINSRVHDTDIPDIMRSLAYGFANSGNKNESYKLLEKTRVQYPQFSARMLAKISKGEAENSNCIDETEVLKTLSYIEAKEDRDKLFNEIKPHIQSYNLNRLFSRSNKMHQVMKKYDLNYGQAVGWTSNDLQIFLLLIHHLDESVRLNKTVKSPLTKLNKNLLLMLVTYFGPSSIPDARILCKKFIYRANKISFLVS